MATLTKSTLPSWSTFPKDSIYPNFYKGGYPTSITRVANKHIIFEHDILLGIEPVTVSGNLRNPIEFLGFIIDNKTNPVEARIDINGVPVASNYVYAAKEITGGLIGDSNWCDTSYPLAGNDYTKWQSATLITLAANQTYLILDFEHHEPSTWTSAHWTRLAEIFDEVRTACPWVKIGLWARHDATIGPFYDPSNSGVENATGFNFYAQMYIDGPGTNVSGFYNGTDANAAFPFGYLRGRQSPMMPYCLMHSVEVSKAYNPTVLQIPTVWCEIEKIPDWDGDAIHNRINHYSGGRVRRTELCFQTPPEYMFAFSILGLTVWDGCYWFGTGANYSDNIDFGDDVGFQPDNNGNSIYTEQVRNKTFRVFYRWTYKGFINYNVVANYMCSLSPFKAIIEHAGTSWQTVEYKKSEASTWETGLKKYPSWAYANSAPIIRYKLNAAGTQAMFIAWNPRAGMKVQSWDFRPVGAAWSTSIQLVGGWLEMGYIDI